MKSVQRLYYLLSGRLLLFTGNIRKMKREVFSVPYAEATTSAIKALLGMLGRLSWGRRDMLGSMNGKYGRVSVKYLYIIRYLLLKYRLIFL